MIWMLRMALALLVSTTFFACRDYEMIDIPTITLDETYEPGKVTPVVKLKPNLQSGMYHVTIEESSSGEYTFVTTGGDPQFHLEALTKDRPEECVIFSFRYQLDKDLSDVELFFSPIAGGRSAVSPSVKKTEGYEWKEFTFNIADPIKSFKWGKAGDFIRMDIGTEAGITLIMRDLKIREMTEEEKAEIEKNKG